MAIRLTSLVRRVALATLTAFFFWFFPTLTGQAKAQELAAAPTAAAAQPPRAGALMRMDDVGAGTLLLRTRTPGEFVEAPRVATDVAIDVTGIVARTRLTQRFENPSDAWVEGVYVFPLPADAGVDRLKMLIGDRFIEGRIEERQEARRIYEEARDAGQRAGLVEQERPNMFTSSVANIGPHETVVVQIEYQDVARLEGGVFSLRTPMVVGPRYSPAPDLVQTVAFDRATGFAVADPVPDRDRITPPVMHPDDEPADGPADEPGLDGLRLPVSISVDLKAGFALGEVESLYHPVVVETRDEGREATLALADGPVPANRDFVLTWRAADGAAPQAAAFTETREDGTYLLAMVTPPTEIAADAPRRPREAIFVIDTSGSMAGASMPQAQAALLMALDRLTPQDSFNVIRFASDTDVLFPTAVPATAANVRRAKAYVGALDADGGTEMLSALRAALVDQNPSDTARVRQVVFLTDGAIGNEAALFSAIDQGLGRSRLFTVGIGSAPNTYFMSRAARIGRGTFTHIGDVGEVRQEAEGLFAALERPVMTDITAELPSGAASEVWPDPLPDLYAGEPVALTAKLERPEGTVRIAGTLAGQRWAADLDLATAAEGEGVAQLWARSKIAAIEERRFMGASPAAVDAEVLDTALSYGLVSRLTSLVAVDVTPARPEGAPIARADVPTMLPAGWEFDKVFGPEIETFARHAALEPGLAHQIAAHAPDAAPEPAQRNGLALPHGGTTSQLQMLLGLMLMLCALAWMASRRFVRAR